MATAKHQPRSHSGGESSDSLSDQSSDVSDSSSDVSNDGSSEEDTGEEVQDNEYVETTTVKMLRVQADIDEMRRMMADMDAIKTQLQHRFKAERQARIDQLEHRNKERDVSMAARKTYEVARVEVGVQTEPITEQKQMYVSQQTARPPPDVDNAISKHLGASLPVDIEALAEAAPIKPKPIGLSIYDLVKAPSYHVSRKVLSPVCRQADSRASKRSSHLKRNSIGEQHQLATDRNWTANNSRSNEDSAVGKCGHVDDSSKYRNMQQNDSLNSADSILKHLSGKQMSHYPDENMASLSNSLISSDADDQSAVCSDTIDPLDQKLDAATLLSTSKSSLPLTTNDDDGKTDEQREMEAIRCLLFDH